MIVLAATLLLAGAAGGQSATRLGPPPVYPAPVSAVAFLPGGDLVFGDPYGNLSRWDPETGIVRWKAAAGSGITTVAVSPDGRLAATAGGTLIRGRITRAAAPQLWDTRTGGPVRPLVGGPDLLRSLAFSSDGLLVLGAGVRAPAAGAPGSRAVRPATGAVSLWDVGTGQLRWEFAGGEWAVFLPGGREAAAAAPGSQPWVSVLRLPGGEKRREFALRPPGRGDLPPGELQAIARDGGGERLAAAWGSAIGDQAARVGLFDSRTGTPAGDIDLAPGAVSSLAFSPDGRGLAVALQRSWMDPKDTQVQLWTPADGKLVGMLADSRPRTYQGGSNFDLPGSIRNALARAAQPRVPPLGGFAFLLVLVLSLVWVYGDAVARGRSGILASGFVFLCFWPFSLLVWLAVRPGKKGKGPGSNVDD